MSKPYVIVSPHYNPVSGGIKVMWGLYGHLLARGVEVYMNQRPNSKHIVAIYPEITHGNVAEAETVVRYILNKPGVMASQGVPGPTNFNPLDHLYYFSRLFGVTDDEHYLFLPIIDLHTFKSYGRKRDKKAVFVGKGKDTGLHSPDSIYIDRTTAKDQGQLADLLNHCSVLYGYDPVSAMYECARLCGCRVVLMQGEYSRKEWMQYEPGMNGVSFDKDEQVPLDTVKFREHYEYLIHIFNEKLDKFIERTQV